MAGKMTLAIKKPPIIKQIVATREGHCRLESPMIACPLVHPPAYLVPKPTKKPPTTIMINPLSVNRFSKFISCTGTRLLYSVIP